MSQTTRYIRCHFQNQGIPYVVYAYQRQEVVNTHFKGPTPVWADVTTVTEIGGRYYRGGAAHSPERRAGLSVDIDVERFEAVLSMARDSETRDRAAFVREEVGK